MFEIPTIYCSSVLLDIKNVCNPNPDTNVGELLKSKRTKGKNKRIRTTAMREILLYFK